MSNNKYFYLHNRHKKDLIKGILEMDSNLINPRGYTKVGLQEKPKEEILKVYRCMEQTFLCDQIF